jgi:two-component sensor histidine kinase
MSISIEGSVGLAEADHQIANNLAGLSGVIRLQRSTTASGSRGVRSVHGRSARLSAHASHGQGARRSTAICT